MSRDHDTSQAQFVSFLQRVWLCKCTCVNVTLFSLSIFGSLRAKYASKASSRDKLELTSVMLEGDGTSSWTKKTVARNGGGIPCNNQAGSWQTNTLTAHTNGTLPANTQKYFILDRDELNA